MVIKLHINKVNTVSSNKFANFLINLKKIETIRNDILYSSTVHIEYSSDRFNKVSIKRTVSIFTNPPQYLTVSQPIEIE